MATYVDIQVWVKEHYGFWPSTAWIAHCKEMFGLEVKPARNRKPGGRAYPCPPDKVEAIRAAFEHFGMLPKSRG
ncbi:MAG: hypothetical protein KatS3mg076_2750 [Candidatus Binatia bacterium]|nr:MAG: hypothetical protein KatS3mg076_2750 [Candidatus Binatia bacterium]